MKAVLWVLYWVFVVAGVLSVVGAFFGVIASLDGQPFWFGFFGSLIILGVTGVLVSSLCLAAWGVYLLFDFLYEWIDNL